MYLWDGQRWVSTLSPDGRSRWDGAAWTPVAPFAPIPYEAPRKPPREPTSWTHPLQYTVVGWSALAAIYRLSLPFSLNGFVNSYVNHTIQRQHDTYGTVPPPGYAETLTTAMTLGLWIGASFWTVMSAVLIIGALKRWTWSFYASLVVLGLSVILLPYSLVTVATGRGLSTVTAVGMPAWNYWSSIGLAIAATALFVWMIVALIRRGPWATRRVS